MKAGSHIVLRESVLKTLLYSDIFNYPLTAGEVYEKLPTNHTSVEEVSGMLEQLKSEGLIFGYRNFFSTQNKPELADRRVNGNAKADAMMPIAINRAATIYRFPFVQAVMISGSLSKHYMDEKSDLDYFVVTKPGRLWIARGAMALYKRLFLNNSHKQFCVNYFVDTEHLEIEEKNIFTAMELATLLPVCGLDHYRKLMASNRWLSDFLPNHTVSDNTKDYRPPVRLKQAWEVILSIIATPLDTFLMKVASTRWKLQFGKVFAPEDFNIAFKTRKYVSKNHPNHFQKRITELYQERVSRFMSKVHQS